jgi:predicted acylesterase/phospholipase RssA
MFEQVVLAGGGNRCWWQAGFWDVVAPALELRPRVIVGVSAGSATACLLYANESRRALAYYREALANVTSNALWANALTRELKVFPHAAIFRTAMTHLLGGESFKQLMWTAPEIRIVYSRIPRWLGPRSAVLVGMSAYNLEKKLFRPLHPHWCRSLGFTSEFARLQDCTTVSELVDLIIASSCTPPFTPIEYRDGKAALDGGLVDNIPVQVADADSGPMLVLATRRYPKHAPVFIQHGRVYAQPSQPIAASSWDYTSVDKMDQTYELGRFDGNAFLVNFKQVSMRQASD